MKRNFKLLSVIAMSVITFVGCKKTTNPTPSNAPVLTIVSPNGGEMYQPGQIITIKWSTQNIPSNARIGILLRTNSGSTRQTLLTLSNVGDYATTNDGIEVVKLPNQSEFMNDGIILGTNFALELGYDLGNTNHDSVLDKSDNLFTIK